MEKDEVMEAVRIAHQRSYAQRFEVRERNSEHLAYTAVQILNQIDAMGKTVPGARRTYDQLSEVVHPNAFGALHYFMRDERDGTFEYREMLGMRLEGARLFNLIADDVLRFYGATAKYWADKIQTRIDVSRSEDQEGRTELRAGHVDTPLRHAEPPGAGACERETGRDRCAV